MVSAESPDNECAILVSPLSSHPPLILTSPTPDPSSAESVPMSLPTLHDQNTSLPPRKMSSPYKGPSLLPCSRRLSSRNPKTSLLSSHGWTLRASFPSTLWLLDHPRPFPTNLPPLLDSLDLPSPRGDLLEKLVCRNERRTWNEERDRPSSSGCLWVSRICLPELAPEGTVLSKRLPTNKLLGTLPRKSELPTGLAFNLPYILATQTLTCLYTSNCHRYSLLFNAPLYRRNESYATTSLNG
jgi:hypothetical protein